MTLNFETTNVTHFNGSSYGCAETAAFTTKPRKHKILEALWMNYILIIDLRCTNFETLSFCLIAKVLAASQSTQLLQMLSCDTQIPLYLLKAPETVLTTPTDVSWATCAYLTQGTEIENTKFLRMIKKRVYLSVILVALFMLENYRLHPVRATSSQM